MNPIYSTVSTKNFSETVKAVENQTIALGFRVLHIHDVQATLAEKDFKIAPLKIIEVCNAGYANSALQIDLTVSLLMPCRINVYENENQVIITTVKPKELAGIFNNPDLNSFAEQIEDVLIKIIEASK